MIDRLTPLLSIAIIRKAVLSLGYNNTPHTDLATFWNRRTWHKATHEAVATIPMRQPWVILLRTMPWNNLQWCHRVVSRVKSSRLVTQPRFASVARTVTTMPLGASWFHYPQFQNSQLWIVVGHAEKSHIYFLNHILYSLPSYLLAMFKEDKITADRVWIVVPALLLVCLLRILSCHLTI